MSSKIQIRRDTAANWTSTNPVLSQGEPGLETDTNKVKYGDGSTAWTLLDYASGGSGGGLGDFVSDWQDGINDNVWRKVTVQGTKEFDYQSEGYRLIEITLTSDMLADQQNGNLTFVDADSALFADLWFSYDTAGNNRYLYLTSEFEQNNFNNNLFYGMTNPSAGTYVIYDDSGVVTSMTAGTKITFKYWSEGTMFDGSYYDTYNNLLPDVSSVGATNEITFSGIEFDSLPWSDFLLNVDKHSLTFTQNSENDFRSITNVIDNNDGTYTAVFSGAARTIQTMTNEQITFQALTSETDVWDIRIPKDVLPGNAGDLFVYPYDYNTPNRKYIGGTANARSGYLTINGTTYDFMWWWNFDWQTGNPYVQFYQNGSSVQVSYNQGDTVVLNYYTPHDKIQLDVYRPNNGNWNNGYKWFDWKDDLPAEYVPTPGNGVIHGKGTLVMRTYRAANQSDSARAESMATSFGWTTGGDFDYNPYDPYYREDMSNWGYSAQDIYPMYDFDRYGIIAYSDNRNNDYGYSYKVRIMYEFEIYISEDTETWFNC
jgi:hypothetical protein